MRNLCKQIDDRFKKFTKPRSVPGFLSLDKAIGFNPTTIRLNRSGYEGIVVKRIKVDPEEIRRSRKIEFFSYVIQDDTLDSPEHGEESTTVVEAVPICEDPDEDSTQAPSTKALTCPMMMSLRRCSACSSLSAVYKASPERSPRSSKPRNGAHTRHVHMMMRC